MDERMRGLVHAYLDGGASEGEVRELSETLARSPDVADAFADACRTDAFLEASFGGRAAPGAPGALSAGNGVPQASAARRARLADAAVWVASGVAATLLVGLLFLDAMRPPPSARPAPAGLGSAGESPAAIETAVAAPQGGSPGTSAAAGEGGSTEHAAGAGTDAPPYPFALPGWWEELGKKLERTVDLPGGKRSLAALTAALADAAGVRVELRDGAASLAQVEIDLPALTGVRCDQALQIAATGVTPLLAVCRRPSVVVLTDRPDLYPPPAAEPVRRRMEEVRAFHSAEATARRAEAVERVAKARKALRGTKVTLTFDGAPLADVLAAFHSFLDVPVIVGRPAVDQPVDVQKSVRLDVRDVPAEDALGAVLVPLELSYVVGEDGAIIVTTVESATVARRRQALEADRTARWNERMRGLHATVVERDLGGKRPRETAEALGAATGMPVYPDPGVWRLESRLEAPAAPRTVGDVAAALEKLGVSMVVEPDGVFLLR